ncbi:MAG: hypothetical protein QOF21_3284 [Actinomycetota bacterium]|jgi:GNAT superfamily N-acetyltransferase
MEVRRATVGDAQAVGTAHAASWRATYADLGSDFLASIDDEERIALWTRVIAEDGESGPVYVATVDRTVVAFVNPRSSRDDDTSDTTGEVVALYAVPEAWGSGAGRALMAAAVDELRALGFTDAILWVLENNTRARRFYELAGWALDGAEKDEVWRGVPIHEVRYRRTL